jgi:poly-gamma-glutamate synthesis protein (capsule biosynthesis protein)
LIRESTTDRLPRHIISPMRYGVTKRKLSRVGITALTVAGLLAVASTPVSAATGDRAASFEPESDEETQVVTLLVTGEMLIHPRVSRKAAEYGRDSGADYDFSPMFGAVRPLISEADLALCHLEVQLGVPEVEIAEFPRLAAPAEFATALASAGFDGCSAASNHANDQGDEGVWSTIAALYAAGVAHTGTATTPTLAGGILYELDGMTLGQLSYTYAIQAHRRAHPWSINKIDPVQILSDAAALKARGADFVAVSLHWGQEFRHQPTRSQRIIAEDLMASDAVDLIIGHHAHVLQPIEFVNGKPVLFGLGNFLSNQAPDCCGVATGDGAAVLLRLEQMGGTWSVTAIDYVPTWVHRRAGGYLVRPTSGYQEGSKAWRHLRASLARTQQELTIAGESKNGLTVADGIAWLRQSHSSRRYSSPTPG